MKDLQIKWDATIDFLKSEITPPALETWIEPLRPKKLDKKGKKLYLEAENDYVVLRVNERYLQILESAVSAVFSMEVSVIVTVAEAKKPASKKDDAFAGDTSPMEDVSFSEEYILNPRFNFETFVVGKNNEFAFSAARAVAEAPAKQFNPLFIYGASGLGKTHLMHAIGHYILKNSDKKVLYVSSEVFTNELINAIRHGKMNSFKSKYRKVDVLLIDDIQFLENKDSTQEEFFHTFNQLYDNNKQIVISSDRPPQQLRSLDERLTSRFLWSVTADIQPPDYESRVAILMNKARLENVDISADVQSVINMIAENIKYNIREMEGALTKIISFSSLLNKPIDTALAHDILKDIITTTDYRYSINNIKRAVSKYYNISLKDLDSSGRARKIAYPRQIAMYLIKELTDTSLPKIGEAFGGRDHTTVLYACNKIKSEISTDNTLHTQINEIKSLME